MKKVIFLCLLSFSVCLSKPTEDKASPAAPPVTTQKINTDKVATHTDTPTANSAIVQTPEKPAEPTHLTNPTNETPKTTNDNKPDINEPKQETKPETKPETQPETKPETKPEPKPATEKASDVKPTVNPTIQTQTSTENAPTKPAEAPKTTETPKVPHSLEKARGFDGASFVGGMVLTLGLLAVGFMGLKYYRNRTSRTDYGPFN